MTACEMQVSSNLRIFNDEGFNFITQANFSGSANADICLYLPIMYICSETNGFKYIY